MGTLGQEDGAVLHQGPALAALGTADDLGRTDEEVARREMPEAENAGGWLLAGGMMDAGRHAEGTEGRRDERVHPAEPRFVGLPRLAGGEAERVGHFVMMHERGPAGG